MLFRALPDVGQIKTLEGYRGIPIILYFQQVARVDDIFRLPCSGEKAFLNLRIVDQTVLRLKFF